MVIHCVAVLPVAIIHRSSRSFRAAFVVPLPLGDLLPLGVSVAFTLPGSLGAGEADSVEAAMPFCFISTKT